MISAGNKILSKDGGDRYLCLEMDLALGRICKIRINDHDHHVVFVEGWDAIDKVESEK
jgi:hypothetical protein